MKPNSNIARMDLRPWTAPLLAAAITAALALNAGPGHTHAPGVRPPRRRKSMLAWR